MPNNQNPPYALAELHEHLREGLQAFYPELKNSDGWLNPNLEKPPKPELGEVALPCFGLAKILKKPPPEVARFLAQNWELSKDPFLQALTAAGPYVNIHLKRPVFSDKILRQIAQRQVKYGHHQSGQQQTIVMDYSSPNIAKHLAFHHLRSAVIGKALCAIFSAMNFRVIRINHLGDWGTQFGKMITAYLKWGPKDDNLGEDPVSRLNELYVRFQKEAASDPALIDEAREWFRKLEGGDSEAHRLWERFRDLSLQTFERVYRRLGLQFDETTGESYFIKKIPTLLKTLHDLGLSRLSEGALIVDLSAYDMPPCLLKKADESSLYATRDLCAAIFRAETYSFAHMLYVVDTGQSLHFKQLFKVLELMNFPWAKNLEHINFGIIKFAGARTRTREGNIILLEEVLDEAVRLIGEKIAEKNPALRDKENIAEAIGIGAIIFADLCNRRVRDVNFDWKEILNFDGRTGPYLQYSHARAYSILRKAPAGEIKDLSRAKLELLTLDEEWGLVYELSQYPSAIAKAAAEREPSYVADALLSICERFHRYHTLGKKEEAHRVLTADAELRRARLYLTQCTVQVLANGLNLLGMQAPEEM